MHKSLTLTTMAFPNGPVEEGAFGLEVGVILKQRPQAPPGPLLEPNASSLTAAEYPFTFWPHAVGGRCAQRVPRHDVRVGLMNVPGDWQPLPALNDASPVGFCTQPLEDVPVVEPVLGT